MTNTKTKINILLTAFEAVPFAKTGGLGDVAGTLPSYVKTAKYDIRVMLPKLDVISQEYQDRMVFKTSFGVPLGWRVEHCGIFELKYKGITYYFLDNEYYFHRGRVYGEYDDGERIAYYSKAVCEAIMHLDGFFPDIVHCNDWHTALVPVFIREHYNTIPGYGDIRTIFTIHNLKFQGKYDESIINDILGLEGTPAAWQLRQERAANFLQGACLYADMVTTVSPTYAKEICTPYYGEGLDWLFNTRNGSLIGLLNGIDYKRYDPERDSATLHHYSADNLSGKKLCKLELQKELGLPVDEKIPVLAIISRLTEQKGLDLITYNLPKLVNRELQLVILGLGDRKFEEAFTYYGEKFPSKVSAQITFSDDLSRKMYAGADMLLMPSRFEPCGLSQMMAMRYGCLPVVRETGGLKDTVEPYNQYTHEGTGFSFANYNAHEFMNAIDLALNTWYEHPDDFEAMQKRAMKINYSWQQSAKEYRKLYSQLCGK